MLILVFDILSFEDQIKLKVLIGDIAHVVNHDVAVETTINEIFKIIPDTSYATYIKKTLFGQKNYREILDNTSKYQYIWKELNIKLSKNMEKLSSQQIQELKNWNLQ